MPRAWLIKQVSRETVENELKAMPQWQRTRRKIQPGDTIWAFSTPQQRYGNGLTGQKGYVVYRGEEQIAKIVTLLN